MSVVVRAADDAFPAGKAYRADPDLEARVTALERAVARLQQERQARTVEDDGRRLQAIAAAVGGCVFSAQELLAHSRLDAELGAALRVFKYADTAVAIGRWLRSVMDQPIGGLVVRRIGRDKSGVVWAVQSENDQHQDAGAGHDESV